MSTSAVIEEMLDDLEEFVNLTDGVGDMLEELHALGEAAAPVPDGELVVLLAGRTSARAEALVTNAVGVPARPHTGARRSVLVGLAVAVIVAMGITSAAAAVNELPTSMQRVVAHFSETYLPFSFPRPVGDPPATGEARRSRPDERSTGATKGTRTDGSSAAHRRDVAAKARAQALADERAKADARARAARAEAAAKARADARAKAHAHAAKSGSSGGPDSSLPDGEEGNGSGGTGHGSSSGGAGGGAGQGTGTGTGGSTHAHQGHAGAGRSNGGTAGKGDRPTVSDVHPGKPTSGLGSGGGVSGTSGSGSS